MAVFPAILVLLGPTASGKSALAMALAAKVGAEILSVDSMQVYREMDIGTAKPSRTEQQAVRHHLIDVVSPSESFTAARFVAMADEVIADAARRNVPLIATGGTPLYYKSLFEGLFVGPGADIGYRQSLSQITGPELHTRLAALDPPTAQRLHPNDTRRLIRALEVHHLTGKPISSLQKEWEAPAKRHRAVWIGLSWEKDAINRRVNARVKAMMNQGWLEEVRELIERYGQLSATAGEATGYRELIDHLQGRLSLDDAIEQIKIGTRQLARRQMKWFRRWNQVNWLAGDDLLENLVDRSIALWRNSSVI